MNGNSKTTSISVNRYQINLEEDEAWAKNCLDGNCSHDEKEQCARRIVTMGWHESVEEKRIPTVLECMQMPPSIAEAFIQRWLNEQGDGVCNRLVAQYTRDAVAEVRKDDRLGILTMFAHIVGDPSNKALRQEFYDYLQSDNDNGEPEVTEENFFEELEKSMKKFGEIVMARWAWSNRPTANAGPLCDQCGNSRTGIGGRVCEQCDLELEPEHHCYCCVDRENDEYDEYDAEDEEERRQEMAEENERQMEVEYELNRAMFEEGNTPTEDPHLSPVATGKSTCAGCSCDCRDNVSAGCCGHVCPSCRVSGGWVEV